MTEVYDKGQWVSVKWEKVYPPFKGKVQFYTADTVCVNYLGLGREVPTTTVTRCSEPKKKK